MIERREGSDHADHDRHRMRVAAEPRIETRQLLMHHGMLDDAGFKGLGLLASRQLAIEQKITSFQKGAVLGELLDRITAVKYDPFVEVDERDLRLATCRRGEAGIVGEAACVLIKSIDVDHTGT